MGRRALLVIAAMLIAALGVGLISYYVKTADDRAAGNAKLTTVYITKSTVDSGTPANRMSAFVEPVQVAEAAAGPNPVTDINRLAGSNQVLLDRLGVGMTLRTTLFGDASSAANRVVGKGQVAVQVQIGDPMRVTGLLQPGSKVTVFIKHKAKSGAVTTEVLLSDLEVLTTNGFSPVQGQNGTVPKGLVTFLATPLQAAQLIHTQSKVGGETGEIWLALQGDTPPSTRPAPVTDDNLVTEAK